MMPDPLWSACIGTHPCSTPCRQRRALALPAYGLSHALVLRQALQCLVNIQRSLVDWYQVTIANAAHAAPTVAPGAMADADADDQHMLESDPKPAPAGISSEFR